MVGAFLGYLRFGWFRVRKPHATISSHISHRSLGQGYIHLAVEDRITNSSKVVVKIRIGRVNVFQIGASDTNEMRDRIKEVSEGVELDWPQLGVIKIDLEHESFVIEPGETDTSVYRVHYCLPSVFSYSRQLLFR